MSAKYGLETFGKTTNVQTLDAVFSALLVTLTLSQPVFTVLLLIIKLPKDSRVTPPYLFPLVKGSTTVTGQIEPCFSRERLGLGGEKTPGALTHPYSYDNNR